MYKKINFLREFSVPLLLGVITALVWVNAAPQSYYKFIKTDFLLGNNLYFLVNDVFMALFFALAGVEIIQSLTPGGDLNPLKKAFNPLLASFGGVIGPIVIFGGLNSVIGSPELANGWGIPTATDIALAWVAARFIFGSAHPAVKYLLLLAVADDLIGLVIIAIFYPEPLFPVKPVYLLLVLAGIFVAVMLRKMRVRNYLVYLITAGTLSWTGLYYSALHPALSLIFIMPFLPQPVRFKNHWSCFVDFGLFMFGLTNAGVKFSLVSTVTWLVFFSLVIGKTVGIYSFSNIARCAGFPFPRGMRQKELIIAALIAAMGLTVALLITGAAFTSGDIQSSAKMGALLSAVAAPMAFVLSKLFRIKKRFF